MENHGSSSRFSKNESKNEINRSQTQALPSRPLAEPAVTASLEAEQRRADQRADSRSPEKMRNLQIPLTTILKIVATALTLFAIWHLRDYIMLLFVSFLLAVALDPLVEKLRRVPYTKKVLPRGVGILVISLGIAVVFAGLGLVAAPTMVQQISSMIQGLPAASQNLVSHLPYGQHLSQSVQNIFNGKNTDLSALGGGFLSVGQAAAGGLTSVFLVFVFTVYLLVEGRETYEWLCAFFSPRNRAKIDETARTLMPVISAFVVGQLIASVLCSIYAFATLSLLGVPAALMLAVLAGIFDILPIIGVIMFMVLAAVMASTVSLWTSLIVIGLYMAYHVFEAYILLPMIYGNRLRLSGLVVLLSILVGASLGGIIGAIAILPIVASYPAIEKIWLRRHLGDDVIEAHAPVENEIDAPAKTTAANEQVQGVVNNSDLHPAGASSLASAASGFGADELSLNGANDGGPAIWPTDLANETTADAASLLATMHAEHRAPPKFMLPKAPPPSQRDPGTPLIDQSF